MANRERGELRLVARHRSYLLRLTVQACCELEDRTGRTLAKVIAGVNAGSATDLRWLFWTALQDRHGEDAPTPDAAGLIANTAGGLFAILTAMRSLVALNQDDRPSNKEDEQADASEQSGSLWRRLYISARGAGVDPAQFWRLTLRELWLEMAADREQRDDRVKRDRAVAWFTASLTRAEKMPAFGDYIGQAQRPARQSWQDMKAMVSAVGEAAARAKK